MAGEGCRLRLRARSGPTVRLQYSPDLRTWYDWRSAIGSDEGQDLLDADAPRGEARFCRALGLLD